MMVNLQLALVSVGLAVLPWAAAQGRHAIVGVQTGINRVTGQVPERKNINTLAAQAGPEWDLFIQAVRELQNMPEADPMSYFQISGIHGQPYMTWDGDTSTAAGTNWLGYCPHNEHKFMSWHRPYVALYEQALVAKAQEIAQRYPRADLRRYQDAANVLRMPFWDWARDSSIPSVLSSQTVRIRLPTSTTAQPVLNPLANYDYPQSMEIGRWGPHDSGDRTRRCSPAQANSDLQRANLMAEVYNIFIRATNFQTVASTQSSGSSFESPHNAVHMRSSCGGDMGNPNIAAFDPLFMMHHANIDRLFAMWQAIYYNQPITFRGWGYGQLGTPQTSDSRPTDPLKPFRHRNGGYHTSQSITRIADFGYTYPELTFWNRTAAQLSQDVKAAVNNLYGNGQNILQRRQVQGASSKKYFAQLEVDRTKVPLPCEVRLFLDDKQVGSITLLSIPAMGKSYGEVPLQRAGSQAAELEHFEGRLKAQVLDPSGKALTVPEDAVVIDVEGSECEAPPNNREFPKFKNRWRVLHVGKVAGY